MTKQKTSFTLTEEAMAMLEQLAKKYGVSKTAMLELLIREKAKREKLQ